MKVKSVLAAFLAALASAAANAAEVVVYSPYCEQGMTVRAPSGIYRFGKSYTGHRAVVTIPDERDDVLLSSAPGAFVEAWTGNGDYDPQKCWYGTSAGRDELTVELTRISPVMPRILLKPYAGGDPHALIVAGGENATSDRGETVADYCQSLIDHVLHDMHLSDQGYVSLTNELAWVYTNRCADARISTDSAEATRVRIVRWLVNDTPQYVPAVGAEVVLDEKVNLSDRPYLTEADVLKNARIDIDFDKLKSGVVDARGVVKKIGDVTKMVYLVVLGDGAIDWDLGNDKMACPKILNRVVVRKYSASRVVPTPVSSSLANGVARFSFAVNESDAPYDSATPSYTGYRIALREAGATTNCWETAVARLPAKDPKSNVYKVAWTSAAKAVKSGKTYTWRCALYNSKFSDDVSYAASATDETTACPKVWASATFGK